jgi:hypothetical protein
MIATFTAFDRDLASGTVLHVMLLAPLPEPPLAPSQISIRAIEPVMIFDMAHRANAYQTSGTL